MVWKPPLVRSGDISTGGLVRFNGLADNVRSRESGPHRYCQNRFPKGLMGQCVPGPKFKPSGDVVPWRAMPARAVIGRGDQYGF